MDFTSRYKKLNDRQKQAVDHIEGPLLVVAGPGTGKTELLSMRAANILKTTDTLPENILCLTFTESGAAAMRKRLSEIIGSDAYKVAIHTFHSFGTEVINHNGEYFYQGANFRPASDLNAYELLRTLFDSLDFSNPLSSKMNGEYTHLRDTITVISELKKSGLTNEELLQLIDANDAVLDAIEPRLAEVFSHRISRKTIDQLTPIAAQIAELPANAMPPGISPLQNVLALSMAHAVDAATDTDSTKPITTWKNTHLEKDANGKLVFKDRRRSAKLRAVSLIYYQYLMAMQEAELYDFDDMVLRVVHAMEVFPELRYNLQEKYLYIMVDEFQDTNLAQARILHNLTATPTGDAPNIMAVGDDDQAIYSFQGAEVGNILSFRDQYETAKIITLTDNYRSTHSILEKARSVITLGEGRLEQYIEEVDKTLTAHRTAKDTYVSLLEYSSLEQERRATVQAIKQQIDSGISGDSIAVLARRHHELVALLPYFAEQGIHVNYERRDNVLESEVIIQLVLLARIVCAISEQEIATADALLPQLFAHPSWGIPVETTWKLSLAAYKNRGGWLEQMAVSPEFIAIHSWLLNVSANLHQQPAEHIIDVLLGVPDSNLDSEEFTSPLYNYFFTAPTTQTEPTLLESYIEHLEALRTIRSKLREYRPDQKLLLRDFIEFIDLHHELGSSITSVRKHASDMPSAVHLMTAHKSKGLEFEHVYIVGAVDSSWGEQVRTKSRLIGYPENLPISPSGDSFNERLRLFFVAMTRAKTTLTISYAATGDNDKALLPASFLANEQWQPTPVHSELTPEETIEQLQHEWYHPYASLHSLDMQQLLSHTLESYKLSVTHLTSFLDVTRGGPQYFLLNNLLRFPKSKHPSAEYGSAIHDTLQRAHSHLTVAGVKKPIEDILQDFEHILTSYHLSERDHAAYLERGTASLSSFLQQHYGSFTERQKVELSFANQQSRVADVHLTGALDLVDLDTDERTMVVTDYKTGGSSSSWQGKTDHEKLKLHKYRQQLLFYKLLVEHSRDYGTYTVHEGILQFVEPDAGGHTHTLRLQLDEQELERLTALLRAVWHCVMTCTFPDTTAYPTTFKGVLAFEDDLIEQYG